MMASAQFKDRIAVNQFGLVCMLSQDGNGVLFSHQKGPQKSFQHLPITGWNSMRKDTTRMVFNLPGDLLVFWNNNQFRVVSLSKSLTLNDGSKPGECLLAEFPTDDEIISVKFHSYCPHTVVVLLKSSAIILDLLSLFPQAFSIPNYFTIPLDIPTTSRVTDMSFGPDIGFLKFTLFLLTGEGNIYYLCPVLPPSLDFSLPPTDLLSLTSLLEQRLLALDNSRPPTSDDQYTPYESLGRLLQTLAHPSRLPPPLVLSSLADLSQTKLGLSDLDPLIGEVVRDSRSSSLHPHPFLWTPQLQGPLALPPHPSHSSLLATSFSFPIAQPLVRVRSGEMDEKLRGEGKGKGVAQREVRCEVSLPLFTVLWAHKERGEEGGGGRGEDCLDFCLLTDPVEVKKE